jgi:hypothetical protein
VKSGAEFSKCRTYRYVLWRRWNEPGTGRSVLFIGLNPSTADETVDDPTIRRCIGFAKRWGYGELVMMNAFAARATDPRQLHATADPIGPENDQWLIHRQQQADLIVAAWGMHCSAEREHDLCQLLNRTLYCLGHTQAGRPKHPLYLRRDTKLERFYIPAT